MALFLYRVGRAAFNHRRLVLGLWVLILIGSSLAAAKLSGPTSTSFSIPGTEAQQAIDTLQARFPALNATGGSARVVFAAPEGATLTDPANTAKVEQVLAALRAAPKVANVSDPFTTGSVSPDQRVALAQVTYAVQAFDLTDADRKTLTDAAAAGRAAGLTVEEGGDALQPSPEQGASEAIGIAIAAVVLFLTFSSFVAAGLPLLTALVGIGTGVGLITAATGFVELSATTSILAVMIGLAVSIDYALFILSRYRSELAADANLDPIEAIGRASGTAGSAVFFAGLTVVIALTGLSVVGIPILTEMGVAAAVTVAIAVLVAETLLPALIGFAGLRVLGRRIVRRPAGSTEPERRTVWLRWPSFISRRPLLVLVSAVTLLVVIALPALDLRLGLPDDSVAGPSTTQRKAYDLLAAGFGPGFNGPLTVVLDASGTPDAKTAAQTVATQIGALNDVAFVAPAIFNAAGDTAILNVIPKSAPSSAETVQLVADIRAAAPAMKAATGITVGVTGQTAIVIDISRKLGDALLPYLLVVVGLAFLVLTLVFRSLLVPLTATLGFLLSVAATFGAVVAVFQWGWFAGLFGVEQPSAIVSLLPVFMIGVVFGLAMDYQVFLVTRMREEHVHGLEAVKAVVKGFSHGAPVVTSAAIIMMGVFGGFILGADAFIKSIGFAFAIAVFFDAFVVRMTIMPAVLVLLRERAWWLPAWLDRVLPNVDVEGAGLDHRIAARESAAAGEEMATA
jgi:putative drug exporter of the RND superfamily